MRRFQKAIFVFLVTIILVSLAVPVGYAQILPALRKGWAIQSCDDLKPELFSSEQQFKNIMKESGDRGLDKREFLSTVLGCAIKTGKIRLFMVPFFITYFIQFLLSIAGLVAVLFMVIGGYKYVVGGLTEDKESGKKTILHALVGFIVALSAWIVVNFIQVALTS
ncbi:hypothetical protein HYW83_02285 [Candidatus Peregrinibacteria bacterium]|nr:hypothetical protein [Candidatus Peregrinibacteria bacterium]